MTSRAIDIPFDRDGSGRFLPWLIALMVYLAALASSGALALDGALERWDRGLAGTLTVELPPAQARPRPSRRRARRARGEPGSDRGAAARRAPRWRSCSSRGSAPALPRGAGAAAPHRCAASTPTLSIWPAARRASPRPRPAPCSTITGSGSTVSPSLVRIAEATGARHRRADRRGRGADRDLHHAHRPRGPSRRDRAPASHGRARPLHRARNSSAGAAPRPRRRRRSGLALGAGDALGAGACGRGAAVAGRGRGGCCRALQLAPWQWAALFALPVAAALLAMADGAVHRAARARPHAMRPRMPGGMP